MESRTILDTETLKVTVSDTVYRINKKTGHTWHVVTYTKQELVSVVESLVEHEVYTEIRQRMERRRNEIN